MNHTLDVQFFNRNHTVLVDKPSGELVNKIMSAVSNSLMDTRQSLVGFAARFTALRRSALLAARFCQGFFIPSEETRIGDESTIGEGGELIQPNVDTDRILRGRKRLRFIFARKTSEPFSRKAANRTGFGGADERPMYNGFYLPNFGDLERTPDKFTATCLQLGKRDAVVNATPLHSGIPWSLAIFHAPKKGFECEVYSHRDILEDLRMCFAKFRMRFLPLGKARNLVIHRE